MDAGTLSVVGRRYLIGHFDPDLLRSVTLRPDDHRSLQTGHGADVTFFVGDRVDLRQILRFVRSCGTQSQAVSSLKYLLNRSI